MLIARAVRDEFAADGVQRLVAASIGPYGAALADGSEYSGRYGVSAERLRAFHRPRLELLAAAGADLLAVETIPDVDEAEVLVDLLDEIELPAWFSFSASGVRTRADRTLGGCLSGGRLGPVSHRRRSELLPPEDVLPAVQLAVEVTGGPAVGYPNRGETWDADTRQWAGLRPLRHEAGVGLDRGGHHVRRRVLPRRPGRRRRVGRGAAPLIGPRADLRASE